ncbi:hypothetical protein ACFLUU_03985 [Chloroflexota bacterium]
MMRPDDNGCSVLNETNFAWLKDYMEPVRERFDRDSESDATRTELSEFTRENQRLKQLVAELSHSDRPDTSFFSRILLHKGYHSLS